METRAELVTVSVALPETEPQITPQLEALRQNVLSAFQQIEDNLALIERYHTADGYERSAVIAAQQALDYSLIRYRSGAVNYLDVVVSQTAALQSRIEALDITTRQLRASVQLIRALGGGWQPGATVAAR